MADKVDKSWMNIMWMTLIQFTKLLYEERGKAEFLRDEEKWRDEPLAGTLSFDQKNFLFSYTKDFI